MGERRGRVIKGMGTRMKDPWTEPEGLRLEGRRWGWLEQGKVVVGKWRQLYLNNNKTKCTKRNKGKEINLSYYTKNFFDIQYFQLLRYIYFFRKSNLHPSFWLYNYK